MTPYDQDSAVLYQWANESGAHGMARPAYLEAQGWVSEGYEALRHGRRFLGVELKPEYFEAAAKNLTRMETTTKAQGTLAL